MKKILKAKKIILTASGETKATCVAEILKHKIIHSFMATHLLKNKNVILYADLGACQSAK
jgi:6-phosphogluconolactonase/glucosamine-6-phosphate isomerase/deaminase